MICWLATGKSDRLRIIRGLEFQVELIFNLVRGGGVGRALLFWGLNEYIIIVLWFSASFKTLKTRRLAGPKRHLVQDSKTRLDWLKLGVRKPRLSAKFEFRYES